MFNLDVDTVVAELKSIVERYPNNTGKLQDTVYEDETVCVYFLDQAGEPISASRPSREEQEFVTPVCIVGHWVHEFHPELKSHPEFSQCLRENGSVRGFFDVEFEEDPILDVLANVQNQQDCVVPTWGDIDFSKRY